MYFEEPSGKICDRLEQMEGEMRVDCNKSVFCPNPLTEAVLVSQSSSSLLSFISIGSNCSSLLEHCPQSGNCFPPLKDTKGPRHHLGTPGPVPDKMGGYEDSSPFVSGQDNFEFLFCATLPVIKAEVSICETLLKRNAILGFIPFTEVFPSSPKCFHRGYCY